MLCGTKKLCGYTYQHRKTVSLHLNNGKSAQEFRVHRSNGFKWLSVRSLSASYSHFYNESAALKKETNDEPHCIIEERDFPLWEEYYSCMEKN